MRLQQLRDLLAVVSHGGYRAAARALDVSQAGLTKSLAKLEEEHEIVLIERTSQGIALTAAGEEFVSYARAVLQEADRAEAWLNRARRPAPKQVKVGASVEPSLRLVPSVLKDFRNAFPKTTIHLTQRSSNELVAAVLDNRLDFAVMRLPQDLMSDDLHIQPLYSTSAAILARRGHPLSHATSVSELVDSHWIVVGDPSRPGHQDESIQELFLQHHLGRPRFAAVSDSVFGAISMLIESDCVARLPAQLLRHPLTQGNLIEIAVREQSNLAYQVGIVSKAARRLSPEAAQLVAMLRSFARLTGVFDQEGVSRA
ncbi:LysR substrate-binding domain-containing protein [Variovorax ureilyticus]|uniref:LysR substrate-binding domain-containing protein n=1 Tax=Variovorax ureilyticus TaxID=1836198 RepID=A0ABU8VQB2_9BURK